MTARKPYRKYCNPNKSIGVESLYNDKQESIDFVCNILDALQNGQSEKELANEIVKVKQLIVYYKLQEVVADRYGKDTLLFILKISREINNKKKISETKKWPLFNDWMSWYNKTYGPLGKKYKKSGSYRALRKVAFSIDYSHYLDEDNSLKYMEILKKCSEIVQNDGWKDPIKRDYNKTIQVVKNRRVKPPKRKKRRRRAYGVNSQITTKECGTIYKPLRIGRN